MKIAVASDDGKVAEHFGHCQCFLLYTTRGQDIVDKEQVPYPGHSPGFLPNFLNDKGANLIISGGMGGGAIRIFDEKGIEVITGARGNTDAVVQDYLKGNLQSSGSVCKDHKFEDQC